jgi:uncharacterized membrane protein
MDTTLVIGPNASLTRRQACWFMASMCGVGCGIAGFFAWLGFWPVVPFAGLELSALAAALHLSLRRNRYREVVSFTAEVVRVESGLLGSGPRLRLEWPRCWARCTLEPGSRRHEPTRLWIRYSGRQVELASCLTDEERERLFVRIKELLDPGWQARPARAGQATAPGLSSGESSC